MADPKKGLQLKPDPNNARLPPWQKYLSKYDADGDGVTSGEEMRFGLKSSVNELFSKGKNFVSNMADGSMQGPAGNQPDGETTPAEYAMLAASFIGPGGLAKGGMRGLLSKGKNFFTKNTSKNITKAKSIVKSPYIPKELPNEGLINSEKLTSVINRSKSKGVIYDQNLKNFDWKPDMFRKMPDVGRRKMVDVNPGGGIPPQRFYQSRGWGDKGVDELGRSKNKPGHWTPIEGFGTNSGTKDWFIKAEGWDKGYGSEVFKNMGTNIKKMGY